MRIAPFTRGQLIVVGLIIVAVLLLCQPVLITTVWVSNTDLDVQFTVSDVDIGKPVEMATIQITAADVDICAWDGGLVFDLVTDANGTASHLCRRCPCFGKSGWTMDTYHVHLPHWRFQVSAAGYTTTGETELRTPENKGRVQRGKPSTVVVQVELKKQ